MSYVIKTPWLISSLIKHDKIKKSPYNINIYGKNR